MTIDQLVTRTKLAGSAALVHGYTTPEGWRFALVLAVGGPGNQAAVDVILDAHVRLAELTSYEYRRNPRAP